MASALLSSALKRSTISTTLFTRTLHPKTPFTTATSRRAFSSSGSSNKSKPNFSSTKTSSNTTTSSFSSGSSGGSGGIPGTNPSEKFMAETDIDSKNYDKTEKLEDEYGFITETTMNEDDLKAAMEAGRPYSYLMVIRQFGVVKLVKKVTLEFGNNGVCKMRLTTVYQSDH
ncbi:hypothetical protein ACH5RR_038666 [Cinchona calisaya]|uniref:Uncharacterized protein n=1 Tax=Cinchona calisaya TaxID=153742 RepID=A0ABD2XWI2_9GENT